jgi:hypothetical protein
MCYSLRNPHYKNYNGLFPILLDSDTVLPVAQFASLDNPNPLVKKAIDSDRSKPDKLLIAVLVSGKYVINNAKMNCNENAQIQNGLLSLKNFLKLCLSSIKYRCNLLI